MPGMSNSICKFKWLSFKKVTLVEFKWSTRESNLLRELTKEESKRIGIPIEELAGKSWKALSMKLYDLNQDKNKVFRNAKLCKEHWHSHLN